MHTIDFEVNSKIVHVVYTKQTFGDTVCAEMRYMDSLQNLDWNISVYVWYEKGLPHEKGIIILNGQKATELHFEANMIDTQNMILKYQFPYYNYTALDTIEIFNVQNPQITERLYEFCSSHSESINYLKKVDPYVIDYVVNDMIKNASSSKRISSKWLSWAGGVITGIATGYIVGPVAGTIAGAVYGAINTYVNQ